MHPFPSARDRRHYDRCSACWCRTRSVYRPYCCTRRVFPRQMSLCHPLSTIFGCTCTISVAGDAWSLPPYRSCSIDHAESVAPNHPSIAGHTSQAVSAQGDLPLLARFVYHPSWLLEVLLVISTVTTHRQHAVRTGPLSCTRLLSVLICG